MRLTLHPVRLLASTILLASAAAHAQETDAGRVYRCPDNSYTNLLSTVRSKGCKPIDNANISIVGPTPAQRRAASRAASHAGSGADRVSPTQQSARDAEARQLLQQELQAKLAQLQQLQGQYNNGQPERQGDERNYQKYLDRTAALKSQIELVQADIDALQRELQRHGN